MIFSQFPLDYCIFMHFICSYDSQSEILNSAYLCSNLCCLMHSTNSYDSMVVIKHPDISVDLVLGSLCLTASL